MKVYRTSEVLAGGRYEVGDIVSYTMEDGEEVEAIAVKEEFDKHGNLCMVFILLDCLKEECRMNRDDTNDGGYEESYLREQLRTEYLADFEGAKLYQMMSDGEVVVSEIDSNGKCQYIKGVFDVLDEALNDVLGW